MISLWITTPNSVTPKTAIKTLRINGTPASALIVKIYAPSMMNSPCAILMMFIIPNITARPIELRIRKLKLSIIWYRYETTISMYDPLKTKMTC